MSALAADVSAVKREEAWQQYMASVVWTLGNAAYKNYPIPKYDDLLKPHTATDTRSGREIFDSVTADLRARVERRKSHGLNAHGACHQAHA